MNKSSTTYSTVLKLLRRRKIVVLIAIIILVIYYFILPSKLFVEPYSTVLEASNGELLSASIAKDGQWRFPEIDTLSPKFIDAILTYEDKRFFSHPGVDVLSLGRALRQNIKHGKVVSGGSTLSMQVIRLSRKGKARTVFQKVIEILLAARLELRHSKEEILRLYASHAPFGGNVVGLEAACWRYFGRDSKNLSWGEAALLAVLPNAPALIHPGKNRAQLQIKRDLLLDKLQANGKLDSMSCTLAKQELIPDQPHSLPRLAKHLLDRMSKEGYSQQKIKSTINYSSQQHVEQILQNHVYHLIANQIHNAAALVADVKTGNVIAYAGNVNSVNRLHGNEVDIITSPRSTGSILKPFLYAAMLDDGKILPSTLLPDIPILINGFSPKNFSKEFDGAVPADVALIRSLNIPAVHLLKDYRYERFYSLLKSAGMTTLSNPPDHYGLSLILGGAEGTLWDIAGMYASMGRTLVNYFDHAGKRRYTKSNFRPLRYIQYPEEKDTELNLEENSLISASAIYQTFDALKEVYRPGEESGWKLFNSSKKIAWKTGTSFGFRDGWAVGVTPEVVIAVWVGNANGEGRPGLTGTEVAAPIMFDILSEVGVSSWFKEPKMELEKILTCTKSGYRFNSYCGKADTAWVIKEGLSTASCPFHKRINVSSDHRYRLHSDCASIEEITRANWFVLPPVQEFYFRSKNITYKLLPPLRADCQSSFNVQVMEIMYPKPNSKIYIPRNFGGQSGEIIFELAHRNPHATVFWHLDNEFIGSTQRNHHLSFLPTTGVHTLTVVDESGETIESQFEVLSKL